MLGETIDAVGIPPRRFFGPSELRELGFVEYTFPKEFRMHVPEHRRAMRNGKQTEFSVPQLELSALRKRHPEFFEESPHWEALEGEEPTSARWCLFRSGSRAPRLPWEIATMAEAAFFAIAYRRWHQKWPIVGIIQTSTLVKVINSRYQNCFACLGLVEDRIRPVVLKNGMTIVDGNIAVRRM